MSQNPPLTRSTVTAPTGSPDQVEAPGIAAGFPGNQNDDDGRAIDDYFEAAESGPVEQMGVIPPVSELPTTTRLITRSLVLTSINTQGHFRAVQILPTDPNRKRVYLHGMTNVGTVCYLLYADHIFSYFQNGVTGLVYPTLAVPSLSDVSARFLGDISGAGNASAADLVLEEHTGPLWVGIWDDTAGATIGVSVEAVTS